MAVSFDIGVGSTTATWSHANSGNCIIVTARTNGNTNTISAVSYGGVALTLQGFIVSNNSVSGGEGGVSLWGRVGGLPAGANTVSVTGFTVWAGSASYAGAASLGTPVTAFGAAGSGSATVTGTTAGGMVVTGTCFGTTAAVTATSPAVLRWSELVNNLSGAGNGWAIDRVSAGGGASTAVAWTNAGSDDWGTVAVEVLPGGGAATGPPVSLAAVNRPALIVSNSGWRGAGHSR